MDDPTTTTYLDVTDTVAGWPAWAQSALGHAGEAGLVLLVLLLGHALLRARRRDPHRLPAALAASAGVLAAYATSELLKAVEREPRPCRTLDVETVAACPPAVDWSLPSNHATVAAALAVAAGLARPRLAPPALLLALGVAASRVAVGVHLPHDVTSGALLGVVVAASAGALGAARPVQARWRRIAGTSSAGTKTRLSARRPSAQSRWVSRS